VDWFARIDFNDVNSRKQRNPYPDGLPDEMQKKLAERYAELFRIYVEHADVVDRVTFWGVFDGTSWLNRGRMNYPLLFDRKYQPKPAFDAVIKTAK
jgi:endo-1,4-beta-xylanase